jgi:hypothetical protein
MRSFWVVIVLTISSLFIYGNGSRAAGQSANDAPAVASGIHEMPDGRWIRERVELLSLEGPPEAERAVHSLAARATLILPQVESALGVRPARLYGSVSIPLSALDGTLAARGSIGARMDCRDA